MDILLILQFQNSLPVTISGRDLVYKVVIDFKLCDTWRKIQVLTNITIISKDIAFLMIQELQIRRTKSFSETICTNTIPYDNLL